MIIKKHTIQRDKFSLSVESIDLSKKGIYLLRGENGSGKTSLLESILKANRLNDIKPMEKQQLISYYSQKLFTFQVSGIKYLEGCNPILVKEYCRYFAFNSLEKDITFLSGGEFVVLALIRCLSKDTPILILDEPTNNLDNETTHKVQELLNRLSQNKTILLSTHDPRLNLSNHSVLEVRDGKLELEHEPEWSAETLILMPNQKMKSKIFRNILFSKFNGLFFAVVLFCGLLTAMIASNYLLNQVPEMEEIPYDNGINLMWIAEEYSTYIEAVVSPSELEKNYIGKTDTMDIEELTTLSNKKYIEDIYVIDTGYLAFLQMDTTSSLKIFSIPEMVATHPLHYGAYPGCDKFLLSGRLPRDSKREAMISFEQMQKNFGYTGDINDVIGQEIKVDENMYTVVGITGLPYISISFDPNINNNYGVIRVTENATAALNNILEQMKELNYGNLIFEDIFIRYDKTHVKDLMDYLIKHGASYQYSSTYVDEKLEQEAYLNMLPMVMLISLVLSMSLCTILLIMASKMFALVRNQIQDSDNCNFQPKKNRITLTEVFIVDFLLMSLACLLEGGLYLGSLQRLPQMLPFIALNITIFGIALAIMWRKKVRIG